MIDPSHHKKFPYMMQAVATDAGDSFSEFQYVRPLLDPSCEASMLRLPGGELVFADPANATAR